MTLEHLSTLVYQFNFNAGLTYSPPSVIEIYYPDDYGFPELSGKPSFPSILYLEEKNGEVQPYVGTIAELLIAQNPGCPEAKLFNTKRLMGNDHKLEHGFTAEMAAEEFYRICGYSMSESRNFRKKRQWDQISHICITRPAAFDPYGIDATIDAATKAFEATVKDVAQKEGLQASIPKIEVLEEPQAALLTFLYERLNNPEERQQLLERQRERGGILCMAVVDIGGGTTDVSVQMLSVSGGQGEINEDDEYIAGTEYATNYVVQFINKEMKDGSQSHFNPNRAFGGLDFDSEAAEHLVERLDEQCLEIGFDIYSLSNEEQESIRNLAMMEAKRFKDSPTGDGKWIPDLKFVGLDKTVVVSYQREEYNAWVIGLIGSSQAQPRMNRYNKPLPTIYSIINHTLNQANLDLSKLDYMYVTGGMSLYPPVYEMLQKEFGEQTILVRSRHNALNDIAMGAALFNTYFHVKRDAFILGENLMLDLPEGEPVILAQAGKPLPQQKSYTFSIVNPIEIAFDILMGRDSLGPDLHKIKMLWANIPMTQIGTPVELKFKISKEHRIQITLEVKSKVKSFIIPIDTSFNQNVARGVEYV